MALLVGLGNPGERYAGTRHNAGFWFIDEVAGRLGVSLAWNGRFAGWAGQCQYQGEVLRLFKPGQFMNRSGGPVAAICRYYQIAPEEMLVAHDELSFEPGVVRLKVGGGHGGHNGLRSIIEQLGGRAFVRLRIGIGRPERGSVSDYVLGKPDSVELEKIRGAIGKAADWLPVMIDQGIDRAMTDLNASTG